LRSRETNLTGLPPSPRTNPAFLCRVSGTCRTCMPRVFPQPARTGTAEAEVGDWSLWRELPSRSSRSPPPLRGPTSRGGGAAGRGTALGARQWRCGARRLGEFRVCLPRSQDPSWPSWEGDSTMGCASSSEWSDPDWYSPTFNGLSLCPATWPCPRCLFGPEPGKRNLPHNPRNLWSSS
jgi:hypothetical protein